MRKVLLSLFVAMFGTLATQAQSPTAPAQNFNVFLQNDAQLINNETEGPVAMGGNLNVNGGYQVSTNYSGTYSVSGVPVTLVVGGHITWTSGTLQVNHSGYVKIGSTTGAHVWYTDENGAYSPIRITSTADYNSTPRIMLQVSSNTIGVSASTNPVAQAGLIDFSSAFAAMRNYSDTMHTYTDNAYLTNSGGTVIPHTSLPSQVKITLNTGLNVLNVNGSDLSSLTDFIYNNAPSASRYLVINVNAPGTFNWHVCNSGGIGLSNCPYILYNFYNCTTLNIVGGGAVEGTVFAPRANIVKTSNMANIEGQVIAMSYVHGGGENHYAVFTPSLPGCGTPASTTAAYTINSANQCLSANSFVFTNGTTGAAPITYAWSFGDGTTSTATNPTKVYTATGTYSVKLRATGTGGVDSVTHTVTVSATPAHDFDINDSVQTLTGNSFAFTSHTPTSGNTYYWTMGDGGTSSATDPTKSYTAAGIYDVMQRVTSAAGCLVETHHTVVVETDSVSGGGSGGLESESLGDLVSKRAYARVKHSISKYHAYSTLPTFVQSSSSLAAKGTATTSTLERFIPANMDATTTARITSPEDLLKITKAVDVFSVDYTRNDVAKGVVLAITTTGKPYNHTKSICDRFRGAELIDTRIVSLNGFQLVQFALKQQNGSIEHSIAFAAGKANNGTKFHLQSKWLISEYGQDDSVFNFQVWATTPEGVQQLTTNILNKLSAVLPIQQTDADFSLPATYIAKGNRRKQMLDVALTADATYSNARILFIQRLNETVADDGDTLIIPLSLEAGKDNNFSIPIYDGYEYEGHLYINDKLVDDIYMADGNWSLDYDKTYTEILNSKPANNFSRVYNDDEFPIYRSVQVAANTTDYISIYKFIKSGEEPADLTPYHSYKFFARGTGTMTVRLIKNAVTQWADQYKTAVDLDKNGKYYQISFDDFTSDRLSTPFDPSDVTAVVYTFIMNGAQTDFNYFADEQSFSPTVVPSIKALSNRKVTISPNPANGKFSVSFSSEEERDIELTLTDVSGRLVHKESVHAVMGNNTVNVELPVTTRQSILLLQIGNDNLKYGVNKVEILR